MSTAKRGNYITDLEVMLNRKDDEIAKLQAKLQAKLEASERERNDALSQNLRDIGLQAKLEAQHKWLMQADHSFNCDKEEPEDPCNCGLEALLKEGKV